MLCALCGEVRHLQMVTRLAEECGELAREVNHFEGSGVKADKHAAPDRHALAKEVRDVLLCALQIAAYYDVEAELEVVVDSLSLVPALKGCSLTAKRR